MTEKLFAWSDIFLYLVKGWKPCATTFWQTIIPSKVKGWTHGSTLTKSPDRVRTAWHPRKYGLW
jgi:hypothetical protein